MGLLRYKAGLTFIFLFYGLGHLSGIGPTSLLLFLWTKAYMKVAFPNYWAIKSFYLLMGHKEMQVLVGKTEN